MDQQRLTQKSATEWQIEPHGAMRVPGVLLGTESQISAMDDRVYQQVAQVATLPGIVEAVYAMPDARPGYGSPRGGVAAFDPEQGGVVVGGCAGIDIAWGVRILRTGLTISEALPYRTALADHLHTMIPNGNGARVLRLTGRGMDAMLLGGARWAVSMGYGIPTDLEWLEDQGCVAGADPGQVSELAKTRQLEEMGTLRSRNHYLEVQRVAQVYDLHTAAALGIQLDDVMVSIHCGSHGLGQQIGVDHYKRMTAAAGRHGIKLPDRDLACAPLASEAGQHYLGAIRAGINCAFANRQILTHLARRVFNKILPEARLEVLYDVSYNTCRPETHVIEGQARALYVHRRGASRALGAGHPGLPAAWRDIGQPGWIGGAMNTTSYIMVPAASGQERAFGSSCHGSGPVPDQHWAVHPWRGVEGQDVLMRLGVLIRGSSFRGVMVEEPQDVAGAVADAAEQAGLGRRVARLEPLIHIKA